MDGSKTRPKSSWKSKIHKADFKRNRKIRKVQSAFSGVWIGVLRVSIGNKEREAIWCSFIVGMSEKYMGRWTACAWQLLRFRLYVWSRLQSLKHFFLNNYILYNLLKSKQKMKRQSRWLPFHFTLLN